VSLYYNVNFQTWIVADDRWGSNWCLFSLFIINVDSRLGRRLHVPSSYTLMCSSSNLKIIGLGQIIPMSCCVGMSSCTTIGGSLEMISAFAEASKQTVIKECVLEDMRFVVVVEDHGTSLVLLRTAHVLPTGS